jgi:hypothetical protein
VHGTAAVPFVYVSWRSQSAEPPHWLKRLKIPLASITWQQIEAADYARGDRLEATISGTGSGTVPILGGGWKVRAAGSV